MSNTEKVSVPRGKAMPLTVEMVATIATLLRNGDGQNDVRNLAILRLGIDTMLRASDLLKLTIGDVTDQYGLIVDDFVTGQKKTRGRSVRCALMPETKDALLKYIATLPVIHKDIRLFPITVRQLQRIMKQFMAMIRVDGKRYSPHSMRRTKASLIYKKTNNIEAVRQLLGHSSVAATSEYLDVSAEDALNLAKSVVI